MKFTKNKPLLIGILAILLVVLFFGTQGTFLIGEKFIYEQNTTWQNIPSLAKSTHQFINNETKICINECSASDISKGKAIYNIIRVNNQINNQGIELKASQGSTGNVQSPPTMSDVDTFIVTKTLNISSSTINKISFDYSQDNFFTCSENRGANGGNSFIYLVNKEKEIPILISDSAQNKVGCKKLCSVLRDTTSKTGNIQIIPNNNSVIVINNQDSKEYIIESNNGFELAIYSSIRGGGSCGDFGASATETISLTNFVVDAKPSTVPPMPDVNLDEIPAPVKVVGKGIYNQDNLFLGLVIAGIVIIFIIIILLFRKR